MFTGMLTWIIILIVIGVLLIIGGVALPVIIPMMNSYITASQPITNQGTPFLQFLIAWWPLTLPAIIIFAVIALVLMGRNSGGSGNV